MGEEIKLFVLIEVSTHSYNLFESINDRTKVTCRQKFRAPQRVCTVKVGGKFKNQFLEYQGFFIFPGDLSRTWKNADTIILMRVSP